MSMKLDHSEWAVFEDTKGDKDTETNGDWFSRESSSVIENGHDPGSSSRLVENNRLDSKDFDDWQEFSSTKGNGLSRQHDTDSSHDCTTMKQDHRVEPVNGLSLEARDNLFSGFNGNTVLPVDPVRKAMETCFPPIQPSTITSRPRQNLINTEEESMLVELRTTAVSLSSFEWSHCLIKDQFLLAMVAFEQEMRDNGNTLEEIDLSGFDKFDRSLTNNKPDTSRQRSVDSDSNGVRFSPQDEFQGLFRPPCSRVDSPIELEFDHDKAVLGLSMLPSNDLTTMKNEMTSKVTKLSNELVSLLQTRDVLQLETVAKNRFIQAMLRVQESKHAMQNTGAPGGIDSSMEEKGISVPTGGDETRLKRRSRSRSFQNISRSLIAKAKSLGTVEEDKTSSEMLLRVVIPYKVDATGSWSVPLLKQWTKILLAMVEKNPNVSSLISDYLTSAIDSQQSVNDSQSSHTVPSESDAETIGGNS